MSVVIDNASLMSLAVREHESNSQLAELRRSWEGNMEVQQVYPQPHFGRVLVVLKDQDGFSLRRYWAVPDYATDPNNNAIEFAVSADGDGVDCATVLHWLNEPKAIRR